LEICKEKINKDPTSPQMCCYTTLWNVSVCKSLYTALERRSASRWWFRSACQSWNALT